MIPVAVMMGHDMGWNGLKLAALPRELSAVRLARSIKSGSWLVPKLVNAPSTTS